jgi:hypothetical protein
MEINPTPNAIAAKKPATGHTSISFARSESP